MGQLHQDGRSTGQTCFCIDNGGADASLPCTLYTVHCNQCSLQSICSISLYVPSHATLIIGLLHRFNVRRSLSLSLPAPSQMSLVKRSSLPAPRVVCMLASWSDLPIMCPSKFPVRLACDHTSPGAGYAYVPANGVVWFLRYGAWMCLNM